jgi:hypothetical protein
MLAASDKSLDVSCPDHLPPLLGLVGEEFAELGWRIAETGDRCAVAVDATTNRHCLTCPYPVEKPGLGVRFV